MFERSYAREEVTPIRTFMGALVGAVMWLSLLVAPGAGFRALDGAAISEPVRPGVAETSSVLAGVEHPAAISHAQ